MTARILVLCALMGAMAFGQETVPTLPFQSVPEFLKLPAGLNFGEVPGVAVDSKGHVFVFTRSNSAHGPAFGPAASQLLEFGPNGQFIREIGAGLYGWSFAHTVRIDRDDNIWAVDKGSDMIVKFNQAGRVVWVFGRRKESAEEAEPWTHVNPPLPHVDGLFRQPTDVAFDSDGNIYISVGTPVPTNNSIRDREDHRRSCRQRFHLVGSTPDRDSAPRQNMLLPVDRRARYGDSFAAESLRIPTDSLFSLPPPCWPLDC